MVMMNKIYVKPRFRKLKPNEYMLFWESLRDARKINNHGPFVLLRDPEVYTKSQNFMIGNGIAGFAISDEGEMISVHKNNKKAEKSGVLHILPKMVRCAFKYGAKFNDCYGDFLVNYYMKSGFIAVAKVKYDDLDGDYQNDEMTRFNKPNFYILIRGVKNVAELDRLKKKGLIQGFDAVKDTIKSFRSAEKAFEFQAELYNKIKIYGYKKRLEIIQNL